MENVKELSLTIDTGGNSQAVSISTTSAQSAAITSTRGCVICATVACFVRRGSNPTALSNGTDQYLPANTLLRVDGFPSGEKLAFITGTGTGTVYITPGA